MILNKINLLKEEISRLNPFWWLISRFLLINQWITILRYQKLKQVRYATEKLCSYKEKLE